VALLDGNIPGVALEPTITLGPDNWRSFHFLYNAVPDLPEALRAGRERMLIEWFLQGKTASVRQTFSQADIDEYERAYRMPGGLRGMLGYYRAVLDDIQIHAELKTRRIEVLCSRSPPTRAARPTCMSGCGPSAGTYAAGASRTAATTSPRNNPARSPTSCDSSSPPSRRGTHERCPASGLA